MRTRGRAAWRGRDGAGCLAAPLERAAHQLCQRDHGEAVGGPRGLPLPDVVEMHPRRTPGERAGGVRRRAPVPEQDHCRHAPSVGARLRRLPARQACAAYGLPALSRTSVSIVIVDSAVYRKGLRIVDDLPPSELGQIRKLACEPGDFVWVGLHEPSEAELATVEEEFGLHPLAVEDAFNAHQRPKLERYGDTLFLTLKSLWYVDADGRRRDRRDQHVRRRRLRHHRAPRRGLGAPHRPPRPRGPREGRSPTARPRSCTPCATGSSTATCR